MRVGVIGAGIAGLTAAYYSAKKGHSVTVYEYEPHPAMRCSYANGGQVSVSNSEVWNTWANIVKGFKWMLKKDAPLLIRPSLDFDKALWLAKFIYHTAMNEHARNTATTIRMGIEARKLYDEICNEEGINFFRSNCGILHTYKNVKYFESAKQIQPIYEANGCEWDILDNLDDIYHIEPTLKTMKGLVGGIYTISDFVGDIHIFCVELANVLKTKYNVEFHYNSQTLNYLTNPNMLDYKHDRVIISAGVNSVQLAKKIGDRLPIYPVKGYSITINSHDLNGYKKLPEVSLLDDEAKIVCSNLGGRFRVAGTAEFAGENYDIRHDRIQPLLNWVRTNFPDIDTSNYSSWACLRPMTPDMMPIYTRSKRNNQVYYHTGHGHLGWTLSPYTAKLLVNQL
jgi:D-amino-acid dehydrogenase